MIKIFLDESKFYINNDEFELILIIIGTKNISLNFAIDLYQTFHKIFIKDVRWTKSILLIFKIIKNLFEKNNEF